MGFIPFVQRGKASALAGKFFLPFAITQNQRILAGQTQ